MSTSVKYLHSGMVGAPTLSGTAGHLIAVLDACLINGFGSGNLDSLSVSSSVATATRAAGHPFEVGSVVEIAGATPAGLNGQKKVVSITTTTYTFDATGVSDGAATGSITHKLAALGWTKEFAATNLAVYKSANVAATGCRLRIDDTGTLSARAIGYETMSDINTGTGPFPTAAQITGGKYIPKSYQASTLSRVWILVGDDRMFYLYSSPRNSGLDDGTIACFGDFTPIRSPDPYACMLMAHRAVPATGAANSDSVSLICNASTSVGAHYMPRSFTGLGGSRVGHRSFTSPFSAGASTTVASGAGYLAYPNGPDNGLYVAPMSVIELSPNAYRGDLPGVYYVPMVVGNSVFAQNEYVTGISGLPGKTLRAINTEYGPAFFDITGPWR